MKFGLGLLPEALDSVARNAKFADANGFDLLYVPDMQSTHRELYTTLAVVGGSTTRARVGSGVTNPLTRDPAVVASAFATLSEYTGGRAFIGLGCGDSALRNIGLQPAKLKDLEHFIDAVRALLTEGRATFEGRELTLPWWKNALPVPIYMSAHGPKSLELAGKIADGVIVGYGLTDSAVDQALSLIHRGARESARQQGIPDVWFLAHTNLGGDNRSAVEAIATTLAVSGNILISHGTLDAIPKRHILAFQELASAYDYSQHAASSARSKNAILIERLGLLDYLAARFSVAGTTEACVDRLTDLKRLGVENLWCSRALSDCTTFAKAWRESVIPRL
jgi:5,10-methylenetetrahydromethanopterin reductase